VVGSWLSPLRLLGCMLAIVDALIPAELNQFFLMLSAFNFNIDITAPEVFAAFY
jgi:hypothetical protein